MHDKRLGAGRPGLLPRRDHPVRQAAGMDITTAAGSPGGDKQLIPNRFHADPSSVARSSQCPQDGQPVDISRQQVAKRPAKHHVLKSILADQPFI